MFVGFLRHHSCSSSFYSASLVLRFAIKAACKQKDLLQQLLDSESVYRVAHFMMIWTESFYGDCSIVLVAWLVWI